MAREFLTQVEMKSLCDAAEAAWRSRARKQRKAERAKVEPAKVAFTWNGQAYAAQRSRHELAVETADGVPIGRRFYD